MQSPAPQWRRSTAALSRRATRGQHDDDSIPLACQINRPAEKLDVSRATIYRLVKDKHLKLVKVGKRASRITAQSLTDYLESRRADNAM